MGQGWPRVDRRSPRTPHIGCTKEASPLPFLNAQSTHLGTWWSSKERSCLSRASKTEVAMEERFFFHARQRLQQHGGCDLQQSFLLHDPVSLALPLSLPHCASVAIGEQRQPWNLAAAMQDMGARGTSPFFSRSTPAAAMEIATKSGGHWPLPSFCLTYKIATRHKFSFWHWQQGVAAPTEVPPFPFSSSSMWFKGKRKRNNRTK